MDLPLPLVVVNWSLASFVIVTVAMIGVTVFVLGKVLPADGRPPLITQMLLAFAVLGGGCLLLVSLVFVFLNSDGTSAWTWVLLAFNFMMMFPAGIWFIGLVVFKDRRIDPTAWFWPVLLALVATGTEALMGILFAYGAVGGPIPTVDALATGLSSVWFFWSMAAVMAALLVWAPLGVVERWALVTLAVSSVVAPWVTAFPTVGGLAMTALMGASFVALVRALLKGAIAPSEGRLLAALAGAFFAMTIAGFAVTAANGSVLADLAFGAVMAVVMGFEVAYLIRRYYTGRMARPWVSRSADESEAPSLRAGPLVPEVREPRPTDLPVSGR